jgi:hypothetical protein
MVDVQLVCAVAMQWKIMSCLSTFCDTFWGDEINFLLTVVSGIALQFFPPQWWCVP